MRAVHKARPSLGQPAASSRSIMAIRQTLAVMILLALFYVGGSSSPAHAESTFVLPKTPQVINATNTSLTVMVDADSCSNCMIYWKYKVQDDNEDEDEDEKGKEKEKAEEQTWRSAGTAPAGAEHVIAGLSPNTTYNVSATPTRDGEAQPHDAKGAPFASARASTCPSSPETPPYIWSYERREDSLKVSWGEPKRNCVSNRYALRWKRYDTEEDLVTNSSESAPACPTDAILLQNLSIIECEAGSRRYCYTIPEDLTPITRYVLEVATVDWTGACSALETARTATPLIFWRGVTFGMWTLIVLGIALLLVTAVVVFFIIKRKAARKLSIAEVAFSKEQDRNDGQYGDSDREADEYVFPEPVTRFEKKTDQQHS